VCLRSMLNALCHNQRLFGPAGHHMDHVSEENVHEPVIV